MFFECSKSVLIGLPLPNKKCPPSKILTPWKILSEFDKKLGFGLAGIHKDRKFPPRNFVVYLSCHYGFTNYFEILNFIFSNTIPEEISTC